jgi:hypothetical protein
MSCREALTNALAQPAHWPTRRKTIDGIANASRHRCSARVTACLNLDANRQKRGIEQSLILIFRECGISASRGPPRWPRGYAENGVMDPTRKFLPIASSCKIASCLQRRMTVGDYRRTVAIGRRRVVTKPLVWLSVKWPQHGQGSPSARISYCRPMNWLTWPVLKGPKLLQPKTRLCHTRKILSATLT